MQQPPVADTDPTRNRYVDVAPEVHPSVYVAPSADLIGAVTIAERSSVWFQTVLRADDEPITIGAGSNVQDGCILHIDPGEPLIVGDHVTIGHRAIVHGARIDDDVMIAIGAVVLTGARIGSHSIIGAGAVVKEGMEIPPESLVVGVPARVVRRVTAAQKARIRGTAETYIDRGRRYAARPR